MNCEVCGRKFKKGDYIYEIKLDNEKIILSHGYPCCDRVQIKRLPVENGDWWIRRRETFIGEK